MTPKSRIVFKLFCMQTTIIEMGNNSTHNKDKKRGKNGKKRKSVDEIEADRPQADGVAADIDIAPKKSAKITRIEGTPFDDFEQVLPDELLISIFLRCDTYALSVVAPKIEDCSLDNTNKIERFNVTGTTQNIKKVDQRAELNQMLLIYDENGFTGEGKYIKFFNEYHARWQGTINDTFDINLEEYYNYEQYPYYYEGKLDPETGVIKGKYHKNNIEGVFEFKMLPKVVLKNKNQ